MKKTIRTMGRKKNMRFVVPPFVAFAFVCAALGAAPSSSLMTHAVKEMIDDYCSRLEHVDQNPRLARYTNIEHSVSLLSNSVAEARMLSYWAERAMAIDFSMLKYKDQRRVFEIDIGGCSAAKPTFPLKVVENVTVPIAVCILSNNGTLMREVADVYDMLPKVNDIYEQVGMSFYIESVVVTNIAEACGVVYDGAARLGSWSFDQVANLMPDADGLKCYFIGGFVDSEDTLAANGRNGMLLGIRSIDALQIKEVNNEASADNSTYVDNCVCCSC